MAEFGFPNPKDNTLDFDERWTYAHTCTETWQIMKFFLEELKPIDTAELEPEDCKCDICAEDLTMDSHRAVRLPCGHHFGESCIKIWLSPFASCVEIAGRPWGAKGANTCPKCRREFFPKQTTIDLLPEIECRIKLWDKAYAHVGIALSEKERQAREDLLQYVGSYHAHELDEYYTCLPISCYPTMAHSRLLKYSISIKRQKLTPAQQHLRQDLEEFATTWVAREEASRRNFPYGYRNELFSQDKED